MESLVSGAIPNSLLIFKTRNVVSRHGMDVSWKWVSLGVRILEYVNRALETIR